MPDPTDYLRFNTTTPTVAPPRDGLVDLRWDEATNGLTLIFPDRSSVALSKRGSTAVVDAEDDGTLTLAPLVDRLTKLTFDADVDDFTLAFPDVGDCLDGQVHIVIPNFDVAALTVTPGEDVSIEGSPVGMVGGCAESWIYSAEDTTWNYINSQPAA